ncbi:mannosyltransferase [Vibrio nigripulchritudo ATCC 27043]|uniref:glycosyltransferase n=1 Tax=Vibrio nigripulchritudo TaxID=28173 RepID=UPI00021C189E|nr:glycosyltransferase [Vibrio nigripulchritudo]EGU56692.1 mannosyltransferase [Vibrio nigripulchritudo ATCC 27043]
MLKVNISPEIFHSQTVGGISRYFSELKKIEDDKLSVSCDVIFGDNEYLPGKYGMFSNRYINRVQKEINRKYYKYNHSNIRHLSYYDYDSFSDNSRNVITVYDCIHEKFGVDFNDELVIYQKRRCIENADKIISISNTTAQDVIDIYGVPDDKIQTIYLGVDFEKGDSRTLDDFNCFRQNNPYILFVGGRNGYKNFSTLLEAYSMSSFRKNGGMLVAFGAPASVEEIRKLKFLGLSQHEIMHVQGNDETLNDFYRNAYLHIVPSLYEGFGLTPFESIASGCRTIVHSNSVFNELFCPHKFVFDLNDTGVLIELMDDYNLNDVALENISFLSKSNTRFTWDNMRKETSKFYLDLL